VIALVSRLRLQLRAANAHAKRIGLILNRITSGLSGMTRQFGNPDAAPRQANTTDVFVIMAVTILSLTSGAWLLAQVGVAIWWAMVGALAVYAVLLTLHLVARRSLAALDRAPLSSHHEDTDWLEGPADRFADHLPAAHTERAYAPELDEAPVREAPVREQPMRELPAHELPERREPGPFAFRPSRAQGLELPMGASNRAGASEPRGPTLDDVSPQEVNVEIIQDLIKKLADELNAPIPEPIVEAAADASGPAEAMIGRSVAALETTARGMRAPAARPATPQQTRRPAANAIPDWWPSAASEQGGAGRNAPAAGKPPSLNPELVRIAEAVAAERIEVLLEPIQALTEGRTRHFEISMRLLTEEGAALGQSEFARVARGSGLMPKIDAERMIRAARVARRLGERGRQGSVMSVIAGESLTDTHFLDAAANNGTDGRMNLVLSFAQSEVRNFTAGHAEALGQLADAGFGFALEDVTDLDMDFGALKEMGFEFIKLDAPVFLEGLEAPGGLIPADDICRHLSDFGLTLIVGRIEDDRLLARILGFGVLFGKGTLFGGPKLVKPEVVATPAVAA
jgi:EAL domain-containing protein (putative c-di-GMP-specific phosphodiesterase class I)